MSIIGQNRVKNVQNLKYCNSDLENETVFERSYSKSHNYCTLNIISNNVIIFYTLIKIVFYLHFYCRFINLLECGIMAVFLRNFWCQESTVNHLKNLLWCIVEIIFVTKFEYLLHSYRFWSSLFILFARSASFCQFL